MAQKILGLDLGTNSIGISLRNPEIPGTVSQQLEYFTSVIFPSGVGNGKSGEFSYAAERTKHRSARRLNQARRYRIWQTLNVLIEHGLCPLSEEDLKKWSTYDKAKGLKREYPVDARAFEQWVRLDFDMDGIPEYSSPYQLRAELMTRQFDFENETERYKLGRAIYHIAQRRGFKSSKGETLQQQENVSNGEDTDMAAAMKKSEETKSKDLKAYMEENNCPTAGCAFYHMEKQGIRVRANEKYQAVRSLYEEEIRKIFEYQVGLSKEDELLQVLVSRKKGTGSLFYKRPLRSQKGQVGKCTFEKSKTRCPISRPEFEMYRAWTLINNLRYQTTEDEETKKPDRKLDLSIRKQLFEERFVALARDSFKVEDILKWLQKKDKSVVKLNYENKTTVMGCPIIYRLKALLGEDWMTAKLEGRYTYEDLWHICFTADDNEDVEDFVNVHLEGNQEYLKKMLALNGKITADYASLSLKAINNILYFLQQGYLYSDAVVLAKLPDVFGNNWDKVKEPLLREWGTTRTTQESRRLCYKIANNLISKEKLNDIEDRTAFHDTTYILTDDDRKDIQRAIIDTISYKAWQAMATKEQENLRLQVEEAYQNYFRKEKRDYYRLENLSQAIETLIRDNFMDYVCDTYRSKIQAGDVLYHPSMVDIYPDVPYTTYQQDGRLVSKRFVQSPETNVFRNPMVMRVLHTLRSRINQLIKDDIIDENTQIVIETARDFNDANQRWAIRKYQDDREKENQQYKEELKPYLPEDKITETDIDKVRLWHEQNKICLYTGKIIDIKELLEGNKFEIEHTAPRSKSFDDSLANKTICETHFNRYVKKNRCPKDLEEKYLIPLMERLKPWEEKVASLRKQITDRKNKTKTAGTKEQKDLLIRQRHVLEMELAYWSDKVSRFKKSENELTEGFRHSQLVDTRIITKYAYHLLRATFEQVSVQRGEMTADFRKALGLQSLDEKKDRSRHSHHAIDATMLTLIPKDNLRDAILEKFSQKEEAERHNPTEKENINKEYQKLLNKCNIAGVGELPQFIDEHILIQHISKDQTLTPASRRVRARGKVVKKNGNEMFQRGDILRGQLHLETWYGAIAEPQRDEQGHMLRDKEGHYLTTDKINYVVRTALKYKKSSNDSGFKTWEELEKVMVDKALFEYIRRQHQNESFQEAMEAGIRDTQGKLIRHIRCYVPSIKNPKQIKLQTYKSSKDYKNFYYAKNGDNVYYALYWDGIMGHPRKYEVRSLMQMSEFADKSKDINSFFEPSLDNGRKSPIPLYATFTVKQTMVLVFTDQEVRSGENAKETMKEIFRDMSNCELSKRLYKFQRIYNPSDGRIQLCHHLDARDDKQLQKDFPSDKFGNAGTNGFTNINIENPWPKLLLSPSGFNVLVEGKDFIITTKGVEFL